jgi:hypothetical protein
MGICVSSISQTIGARFETAGSGEERTMTIPDVGRCIGSGQAPRVGTEREESGDASGVCVACSGRFAVERGKLVEHESAPEDERESATSPSG